MTTHTLWYTRCPVPTASGIAFQREMFGELFDGTRYAVRNIRELEKSHWDTHFDHSLDMSFREGGGSPPIWARSNGAATRLLGITFMEEVLGVYVRTDDPARTMHDLGGRRCALPVWPKLVFNFFRFAAEKGFRSALDVHDMNERDVKFVDIVESDEPHDIINSEFASGQARDARSYYHDQLVALLDGRVDAIFAKGGEVAQLEREAQGRIRRLYDIASSPRLADRVNNSTPRLLTVSESLVCDHPEAVVRYVQTLVRAAQWGLAHPNEAAQAIAMEAGIAAAEIGTCFESQYPAKLMPGLDGHLLEALGVMKSFLLQRGYIKRDFSVDDWMAPDFLADALVREEHARTSIA